MLPRRIGDLGGNQMSHVDVEQTAVDFQADDQGNAVMRVIVEIRRLDHRIAREQPFCLGAPVFAGLGLLHQSVSRPTRLRRSALQPPSRLTRDMNLIERPNIGTQLSKLGDHEVPARLPTSLVLLQVQSRYAKYHAVILPGIAAAFSCGAKTEKLFPVFGADQFITFVPLPQTNAQFHSRGGPCSSRISDRQRRVPDPNSGLLAVVAQHAQRRRIE